MATNIRMDAGEISVPINVGAMAAHLGARFVANVSLTIVRCADPQRRHLHNRRQLLAQSAAAQIYDRSRMWSPGAWSRGRGLHRQHILNRRDGSSSLAVNEQEVQANQFAASLFDTQRKSSPAYGPLHSILSDPRITSRLDGEHVQGE